jgi:ERCC4-type nuclease
MLHRQQAVLSFPNQWLKTNPARLQREKMNVLRTSLTVADYILQNSYTNKQPESREINSPLETEW